MSFTYHFTNGCSVTSDDMDEFEKLLPISADVVKQALHGATDSDIIDGLIGALMLLEAQSQGFTPGSGEATRRQVPHAVS